MIITFLEMDNDWDAVYFGDRCIMQNHSLRVRDVLELLVEHAPDTDLCIEYHSLTAEEQRYLDDCGSLPDSLREITSGRWMEAGRKFWAEHGEPKRW